MFERSRVRVAVGGTWFFVAVGCSGTSFTGATEVAAGGSLASAGAAGLGRGGQTGSSGSPGGGASSGGVGAGGASSGGASTGGAASGGASTGGVSSGGASTGGASSGGVSSGGTTSTGGVSSGGSATTGGDCGSAVTFLLKPAGTTKAGAFCERCGKVQFTVTDSNSAPVTWAPSCSMADCATCTPSACPPVACAIQPLPMEGASQNWGGTQFLGSTCGAAALSCQKPACAPDGKYKVKMCATRNTQNQPQTCTPGEVVCTTVDFALPMAGHVVGTIGG